MRAVMFFLLLLRAAQLAYTQLQLTLDHLEGLFWIRQRNTRLSCVKNQLSHAAGLVIHRLYARFE